MDAFEKWWASEVVGKPTECFPTYEETFLAGNAEGIKEGLRRAAELVGHYTSEDGEIAAETILKEAGE